jgi:ADP-ribose pyrophosphatase YjhB (NUDIX family)
MRGIYWLCKLNLELGGDYVQYSKNDKEITRIDYYYDEASPAANSIRPAASVAVIHEKKLLMIKRKDSGKWALPGGTMNIGESIIDCAKREVSEETGFNVEIEGLVSIYSDPHIKVEYCNGEIRQEFNVTYMGRIVDGELKLDEESTDAAWIPLNSIHTIHMTESQRIRVIAALRMFTAKIT